MSSRSVDSLQSTSSTSLNNLHTDDTEQTVANHEFDPPFTKGLTPSGSGSASSSKSSLVSFSSDRDVTITARRRMVSLNREQEQSQLDLRLLAASTHMTEISYSLSDLQTRIFEIQELRHKAQPATDDSTDSHTSVIDTALMNLDERLEQVSQAMLAVSETIAAYESECEASRRDEESAQILRKHASLLSEWESVQDDSEVLREELKEDKWLNVFRTVTEQADGMMTSLDKAVNKCHDFIWQVQRRGPDTFSHSHSTLSLTSEKPITVSYEVYLQLMESFEAKKKHYMPATAKVLAIIDKGVQDRVTKNGECLRRHAESTQRWKNLRDRIARIDKDMDSVRRLLLNDPSEIGSTASVVTSKTRKSTHINGLTTSLSVSDLNDRAKGGSHIRQSMSSSALSRSISPFRKLAQRVKIGGKANGRATPTTGSFTMSRTASAAEPARPRASLFPMRGSASASPATPDRDWHHGHSQSLTSDSSPSISRRANDPTNGTMKGRSPWNSSTRVDDPNLTLKASPPKRPSAFGVYGRASADIPPVPPIPSSVSAPRSLSRSSFASSRPWSPVTSSVSTTNSSRLPSQRSRPGSPSDTAMYMTTKPRPSSPSHIPGPGSRFWKHSDDGDGELEPPTSLMQRVASPAFSDARSQSRAGAHTPYDPITPTPRPPSRSMIPMPSFKFSSPSRPGSAMSETTPDSGRSPSSMSFTSSLMRAQTPEWGLKAKLQQLPFYTGSSNTGSVARRGATPRPSIMTKAPPSSFRDGPSTPTGISRSGSAAGNHTPSTDGNPVHEYRNVNSKDPLDVELAAVVNSIPHGLLVERVDPPLRITPREGEEVKAQYAFSNALARKVVTCKLTTLTRTGTKGTPGPTTKKVMCRVGGGWQDLQIYMLNRQSGI